MEAVYHWVGVAVVWGAGLSVGGGALYVLAVVVAGLWSRFLYSQQGNRFYWLKDLWHYLRTGRARWQKSISLIQTHQMLAGWNNRHSHMTQFRRTAPYRRNLLAWMVRRQRANGFLRPSPG